ncbi:DsbA family protein [Halobacterium litoreum]|uniref:DsbA family protein n=1 Tax=Halobacterium litoreum TaxID=2039234 RepID=A0ABD5NFF9_9EURY|nr:thioredoxin domain-containing protein [Halobacterium litoreum]UHH13056.1 DsbA family protein [Halobacterium litoreum]
MSRLDETTRRGLLGLAGALAITGGAGYGMSKLSTGGDGASSAPLHHTTETTSLGLDLDGHPVMGSMDAPVDVYYYTDYQCPFCGRFEQNALPKLVSNEVSSGTARLVFVEFPNIGPASTTAAVLDRCVWRQVRESDPQAWWRWHTTLFDEQGQPNSGWASRENLLGIAEDVDGVDAAAVEACADDHGEAIRDSIAADVERGKTYGVRATPTSVFVKRGTEKAGRVVGAQPYSRFQTAVERIRDA